MVNSKLIEVCNLFEENYRILKKNFMWDYTLMHHFGALYYTDAGQRVNVEAIKEAKKIIKQNTGLFSAFKDKPSFALAVMLSLSPDPYHLFHRSLEVYSDLKKAGFYGSPYLTLAALSIAQRELEDNRPVVLRAREIYDAMKKHHRFLTSSDDYGCAAMLALSDLEVEEVAREMETCYQVLKGEFGAGNAPWSLAHILTLGEESSHTKCKKAMRIYGKLKEKGCKLSKYEQLASLGILALIAEDEDKITEEIKEVYEILRAQKGFGIWSISKHQRTMYAISLVASDYISNYEKNTMDLTLATSLTSILIAQQTAMIVAASSAATVASTSSSSSS